MVVVQKENTNDMPNVSVPSAWNVNNPEGTVIYGTDQQKKDLFTALVSAQKDIPSIEKNSENPFFKSKYLSLDDLLGVVKPILAKNNLFVLQCPTNVGSLDTLIVHSGGGYIKTTTKMPVKPNATEHQVGSSITYTKRYALSALLCISSGEDDDGNVASGEAKHVNHIPTPVTYPASAEHKDRMDKYYETYTARVSDLTRMMDVGIDKVETAINEDKLLNGDQKKELLAKAKSTIDSGQKKDGKKTG